MRVYGGNVQQSIYRYFWRSWNIQRFDHHVNDGGIVCTDNEELYHILLSIRSHGWTRQLPDINLVTGKKSEDQFEEASSLYYLV